MSVFVVACSVLNKVNIMDTSNLTSAASSGHKPRQGSNVAVAAESTSQGPKSAAANLLAKAEQETSVEADMLSPGQTAVPADDTGNNQSRIEDTLRKLNGLSQTSIAFSLHEETGRTVITVSNKESGEKIRAIPSEDFLAIAARLEETLSSEEGLQPGLLVSSKA